GVSARCAVHRIVSAGRNSGARRGRADARRGGRVPCGLSLWRHGILRGGRRGSGGRGDCAAPVLDRPGAAARPDLRRTGGAESGRDASAGRSGGAGGAMKCPYCSHLGDKVVDSRESKEGEVIRRRRECLECGKRFTSYERIDEIPYMVVKKDGTRERFERQKLIGGLL